METFDPFDEPIPPRPYRRIRRTPRIQAQVFADDYSSDEDFDDGQERYAVTPIVALDFGTFGTSMATASRPSRSLTSFLNLVDDDECQSDFEMDLGGGIYSGWDSFRGGRMGAADEEDSSDSDSGPFGDRGGGRGVPHGCQCPICATRQLDRRFRVSGDLVFGRRNRRRARQLEQRWRSWLRRSNLTEVREREREQEREERRREQREQREREREERRGREHRVQGERRRQRARPFSPTSPAYSSTAPTFSPDSPSYSPYYDDADADADPFRRALQEARDRIRARLAPGSGPIGGADDDRILAAWSARERPRGRDQTAREERERRILEGDGDGWGTGADVNLDPAGPVAPDAFGSGSSILPSIGSRLNRFSAEIDRVRQSTRELRAQLALNDPPLMPDGPTVPTLPEAPAVPPAASPTTSHPSDTPTAITRPAPAPQATPAPVPGWESALEAAVAAAEWERALAEALAVVGQGGVCGGGGSGVGGLGGE